MLPFGFWKMYLHRTLGVVDLHLEVVACADHRRIQLEAAADRPAPLVVRVTAGFGETGTPT